MRTSLLFVLLSISKLIYGQSYNSVVSDDEIESFIQWELLNTSKYEEESKLGKKRLCCRPESWKDAIVNLSGPFGDSISFENKLIYFFKTDTLFTREDKEFMKRQYDSEMITEWKVIFDKCKYSTNLGKNHYKYTIPLFSKDKQKVLFWKYFYCGTHCAYARLYIYRKTRINSWKLVGTHGLWMS